MKKKDNFYFNINVSREFYETKEEARACLSREGAQAVGKSKMAFKETFINITEFLRLATSGYSFCNLFTFDPNQLYWIQSSDGTWNKTYPVYRKGPNKGCMNIKMKSNQFFYGAQAIFVDIDFTRFKNVKDYLALLTIPPSCVYMSYSDNKTKKMKDRGEVCSRRFRMVYLFEEILTKEAFIYISRRITQIIEEDTGEPMDDDCGTRIAQYMNGVFNNNETYSSDIIYSITDFFEGGPFFSDTIDIQTASSSDEKMENGDIREDNVIFDKKMINDMESEDYSTFMHHYSRKYCYFYRTERDNWQKYKSGKDGKEYHYQYTNQDYLQLYYNRETLFDGQQRRKRLFEAACIRRLIYPDVDANTLLFNLYVDRERFYDNSDGVISITHLKNKVIRVLNMSEEDLAKFCSQAISYWKEHRPTIIFETGIYNRGILQSLRKEIHYRKIDEQYDKNKSVTENIEAGVNASPATLYRYCKDRGIDTNPNRQLSVKDKQKEKRVEKQRKINLFTELYNNNLSAKENMEIMANQGLRLKYTTFLNWRDKYILPKLTLNRFMLNWSEPEKKIEGGCGFVNTGISKSLFNILTRLTALLLIIAI